MGLGVYLDAVVRQRVELLRAGNVPEAGVLDRLVVAATPVGERTEVDGRSIGIALLPWRAGSTWTVLLVGRYQLSCELLVEKQRQQLLAAGRPFDRRGCVTDPRVWRAGTPAEPTWELWNTRVRQLS